MKFVKPIAIHLAQTSLDHAGVAAYLEAVGAPQWTTNAPSDAEELIEMLGRMCYRSFAPGLNPNVTKVRDGNQPYLANIIAQHHGALLEHACDTYVLFATSRVVTHQVVRHRVGTAYSQESGHYVRVEGISSWFPKVFEEHPKADKLRDLYKGFMEAAENMQVLLADELGLDELPFKEKKAMTTAMRRLVPDGIATALGMTANHRTWRWLIELRTESSNDDEIRLVFADIFRQQYLRYPNLYGDARITMVNGIEEVSFEHSKA
jgi:thymidylate synthase (FAD)